MAPIDIKARIKRRWPFHLRTEISFAHLGTCRRRPPSARGMAGGSADRARFNEDAKAGTLYNRARRTDGLARNAIIAICYRVPAINAIDESDFPASMASACRLAYCRGGAPRENF